MVTEHMEKSKIGLSKKRISEFCQKKHQIPYYLHSSGTNLNRDNSGSIRIYHGEKLPIRPKLARNCEFSMRNFSNFQF